MKKSLDRIQPLCERRGYLRKFYIEGGRCKDGASRPARSHGSRGQREHHPRGRVGAVRACAQGERGDLLHPLRKGQDRDRRPERRPGRRGLAQDRSGRKKTHLRLTRQPDRLHLHPGEGGFAGGLHGRRCTGLKTGPPGHSSN